MNNIYSTDGVLYNNLYSVSLKKEFISANAWIDENTIVWEDEISEIWESE